MRNYAENKKTIFVKVLILFMAVIMPLYAFNTLVNIRSRHSVNAEIVESVKMKVQFYVNILERELMVSMRLQSRLINDMDLNNLSRNVGFIEEYDRLKAMKELQKKLVNIREVNNYVEDVRVYIPQIRMKITSLAFEDMDEREYDAMVELSSIYPFAEHNGDILINISSGYLSAPDRRGVRPEFVISMKISKNELVGVLNAISSSPQGGAMLIGDANGMNIAAETELSLSDHIKTAIGEIVLHPEDVRQITVDRKRLLMAYKKSMSLKTALLVVVPEEDILKPLAKYNTFLWSATALTALITILFSFYIRRLIVSPLLKLVSAFHKIKHGRLDAIVEYRNRDEFGFLYESFNVMVNRLKTLIEQVYEERIRAQHAELKQLQYQINPHFLYNSLFAIHRIAKMEDTESVVKLVHHLAHYYQFLTRNGSDEIPLAEEVNHARDYVEVQHFRFFNRISVRFDDIPDGCEHIMVPRLTLQPIIENGYNHGLKRKTSGGIIEIRMERKPRMLSIHVEDNGEEMGPGTLEALRRLLISADRTIESTGLLNVHRRLRIKYGGESGIYLSQSGLSGLHVEIRIAWKGGEGVVSTADRR